MPESEPPSAERVRAGGKTGLSLLVVAIVALIGVAIVKPWAGPTSPPVAPADVVPSPSAAPTVTPARPAATVKPGIAPSVRGIAAIDWPALGAVLRPHDAFGIRAIVYRASDNSVREEWAPLLRVEDDVKAPVNNADEFAVIGSGGDTAALGVTTPLGDLPLDVRAWRQTGASLSSRLGWRNVPLSGMTPGGDPSARLLQVPEDWSNGNGWPSGEYQLDVLLEDGVLSVHLWLSADTGPLPPPPVPPAPRAAPADAAISALVQSPGAFIASGTVSAPYFFSGIQPSLVPHDEFRSWLGLGADHIFWAPYLYEPPAPVLGTANLLGVALPRGQTFISARLTEISPVTSDLGTAEFLPGTAGPVRAQAVAVFRPPDGGSGFADAVYRVDGTVKTSNGNVRMSWDLPVLLRPSSTVSLLLAADRAWPTLPSEGWTILAPGHRTLVTPAESENLPADPGEACLGGADMGPQPWYVGVVHPGGAFDQVTVRVLAGPTRGARLPIQMSQLVDGFLTMRPIATDWTAGRYTVSMRSGAVVQTISICVQ